MRTRTKGTTSKAQSQSQSLAQETTTSIHILPPTETNPPQVFILPKNASPDARIITLPHPVTSKPHRYFVDPLGSFYEFTRVTAPKGSCNSWLLARESNTVAPQADVAGGSHDEDGQVGFVLQKSDYLVATRIDPLFLLLPALCAGVDTQEWATLHDQLFQTDRGGYEHLRTILHSEAGDAVEAALAQRARAVCQSLEFGPEQDACYRLDVGKLALTVWEKAKALVVAGLPPSMEDHFVRRALEVPETLVKRENSPTGSTDEVEALARGGTKQDTSCFKGITSEVNTDGGRRNDGISHLLRLRTAWRYIIANCVPAQLHPQLHERLVAIAASQPEPIEFHLLDAHLAHIANIKSEAQVLRSIGDNISRKRGLLDDDEAMEKMEAKKRKKQEEDAKKKNMSHGVKKLMKADTSGMKKMSSFFQKAASKK